jgi:hypothetical protein
VDHGTASPDTTSEDEHGLGQFEHFLALADQGIRPHLAGRPLILAGSREEIAAYRRISHQEHLLHAELDGNCDFQTEQNLAEAAVGALEKEADRLAALAFAHFEQKLERTRTLTDPEDILLNAAEGRVHQLFLQRGAEHLRKLPRRLDRARLPQEDWVNAAACETLRHKGEVFELAAPLGAAARPLAAILRY